MSYWINKLLYDMNDDLYSSLKDKDTSIFEKYPLTLEEQTIIFKVADQKSFKHLQEVGVLPVLLFTFARQCGCSVSEYTELLK